MFEHKRLKGKIPVTISIAGSDSGGGAGIQADLKTFAALGVHGATAITCVTAQNTYSVTAVECVKAEVVKEQIRQVAEDMGIDAGKTGMLYNEEIIRAVASEVSRYGFPLVVDPVMIAKSGAPLLKPGAVETLKKHLFPVATVVTPNRFEAEHLTGRKIENIEDAKKAAEEICRMGPQSTVIKGGHLNTVKAVDVLYYRGDYRIFEAERLNVNTSHGTGCSFSAAIAAFIARGDDIPSAVEKGKAFITHAIKFGLNIGKGVGPVNPMAQLYKEASKYQVLKNVDQARRILESSPNIVFVTPEVGINIAMALPYAESVEDVAAIPGRIMKAFRGVKSSSPPDFGASSHLARYILEVVKHEPSRRAAINMKFSEKILDVLSGKGLKISFYDRREEPEEIKLIEGMSIPWGVKVAIERAGGVPDVIYHKGDVGKEPMIVLIGEDAVTLAEIVVETAYNMR
ncbi:bifunctional hydroxymethylpyrimidine kinase/phosphomethylpyrimidine kinase [Candidatus Bathyarchaeota archaeon]|nr:bifunctional hydroxymethylpyrimidine kinase/phosphomethylpyrimidine kinase [Candidatus Bathyarchaeota archaeon]